MICLIKCKFNSSMIALPSGCQLTIGQPLQCPENCPKKGSSCSKSGKFYPVEVWKGKKENSPDMHPVRYSKSQRESIWGIAQTDKSSIKLANTSMLCDKLRFWYTLPPQERVEESKDVLSDSTRATQNEFVSPQNNTYRSFLIGFQAYSDDKALRLPPLQSALRNIFSFWKTEVVFDSKGGLRDEFVWLLTKSSGTPIEKQTLDRIVLNNSYTISQKFFHIFYEIVFKNNPPKGFYWCDQKTSRSVLTPLFRSKDDFLNKYFDTEEDGQSFRQFYNQHKDEILFFLNVNDEQHFFDELTFSVFEKSKEIQLFPESNDRRPVSLGSFNEFVRDMKEFSNPARINQMINFLETYSISPSGISTRLSPLRIAAADQQEDDDIYEEISPECKNAEFFEKHLVLLREYLAIFNPQEIQIGDLRISKDNFSNEVEKMAGDYCEMFFAGPSPKLAKKSRQIRLIKSLLNRNVLEGFRINDYDHINRLIQLSVNMDIDEYLALFPNPKFRIGDREMTLSEYILWKSNVPLEQVSQSLSNDKIISAIISKRTTVNSRNIINELTSEYEQSYQNNFYRYK